MNTYEEVEEEWMLQQFEELKLLDVTLKMWAIPEIIDEFREHSHYAVGAGFLIRSAIEKGYDLLVDEISETWKIAQSCRQRLIEKLESDDEDINRSAGRKLHVYCTDLMRICDKFLDEVEEIKDKLDHS